MRICGKKLSRFNFFDFGIQKSISLDRAVSKRKAEYIAGRYCAHLAMKDQHYFLNDIPVGKHREPTT